MKNDKETIVKDVDVHHETEAAWQVSFLDGSLRGKRIWFPKSQCELYSRNMTDQLSIPIWLWEKKNEEL